MIVNDTQGTSIGDTIIILIVIKPNEVDSRTDMDEDHLIKTRSPTVFKVCLLIVWTICQPMVRFATAWTTWNPLTTLIGFVCRLLADGTQRLITTGVTLRTEGFNVVVRVAPQAWTHRTGARRTEGGTHCSQFKTLCFSTGISRRGKNVVEKWNGVNRTTATHLKGGCCWIWQNHNDESVQSWKKHEKRHHQISRNILHEHIGTFGISK